jgi:hypothetical protein
MVLPVMHGHAGFLVHASRAVDPAMYLALFGCPSSESLADRSECLQVVVVEVVVRGPTW